MAFSYTNFDGMGEGLSNIAKIIAAGPQMAAEADLNRTRRNDLVAGTALKTQQHDIMSNNMNSVEGLAAALAGLTPETALDPAVQAQLYSHGVTLNPNTGAIEMADPGDIAGYRAGINPGAFDDESLSTILTGAGMPFQNTPIGVSEQLAAGNANNMRDNNTDVLKTLLPALLGTGAAGRVASPASLSKAAMELIKNDVAKFLGGNADPQMIGALTAAASDYAAANRYAPGAVYKAAQAMGLTQDGTKGGFLGIGSQPNWSATEMNPDFQPPTLNGSSPATLAGNAAVDKLLSSLSASLGLDLSGLTGLTAADPAVAPGDAATAPEAVVPEDPADAPEPSADIPEGVDPETATDATGESGIPTVVDESGQAYVDDGSGWQAIKTGQSVAIDDVTYTWDGQKWVTTDGQ